MSVTQSPSLSSFDAEDRRIRELVRDLHAPRPRVYWADLLSASAIGWAAFAFAVWSRPFSAGMFAGIAVAVLALYRALLFIHEITHQGARSLRGFETVWNLLVGFPMLIPSCVYSGVHQSHHGLSTYGTNLDPEYLPFASNNRMTLGFSLHSFFIPLALLVRFLILTPAGLVWPGLQRWLVVHASSLTMNFAYRREASAETIRMVRRQTVAILLLWAAFVALWLDGVLPGRAFAIWLAVSSLISFVNTLRTLGAHAYESAGQPLDRRGQLIDSIDTPGALWTELWAPVGLRYHALHHYFPGIPYHNLPAAWKRVSGSLPAKAMYHQVRSPGLAHSLRTLYRKGGRRRDR